MLKIRQISISDRQTLGRLIFQNMDAIEEGMKPVLPSVHPPHTTNSFILAREGTGRAVVIEYDVVSKPTLLFTAIQHLDWFTHHLSLLSQLIPTGLLAPSLPPRLMLILPHLSQDVEKCLSQLTIQPECFIFAHLSVGNQSGLWLTPYVGKTSPINDSPFPIQRDINLTEEEEAYFNKTS